MWGSLRAIISMRFLGLRGGRRGICRGGSRGCLMGIWLRRIRMGMGLSFLRGGRGDWGGVEGVCGEFVFLRRGGGLMGVCMLCEFRKWCIIKHCYFYRVNSCPTRHVFNLPSKACAGMAIWGGGLRSREYVHYYYSSSYRRSKSVLYMFNPFPNPFPWVGQTP